MDKKIHFFVDKIFFFGLQILLDHKFFDNIFGQKVFFRQIIFLDKIFLLAKILFDPKVLWPKFFLEGAESCHLILVLWFKPMGQIPYLQSTSFWYILVRGCCSCCCSSSSSCYRGKTKSTPRLKSWSRSGVWHLLQFLVS